MRASPAWWLEAETQKSHSAGWAQLLPPPLSSNMTLEVVFKLSVPWFPHLSNRVVVTVKQINTRKAFKGIRVTQLIEKSPTSSHFLLRIFFFPFAIETGAIADTGCSRILRATTLRAVGSRHLTQQPVCCKIICVEPFNFKVTLSQTTKARKFQFQSIPLLIWKRLYFRKLANYTGWCFSSPSLR